MYFAVENYPPPSTGLLPVFPRSDANRGISKGMAKIPWSVLSVIFPISSVNSHSGVFSSGPPALNGLTLFGIRDQYIPYARGLIAHTANPILILNIYLHLEEGFVPGDAWHLFDVVSARVTTCESALSPALEYP